MAIGTSAAIGLGVTALNTGFSFAQAATQKKEQKRAENEAQKYLAEARKKLDVNFYEQLGIQKEPYELQREAMLSAGGQLIEAGVESERGAAATAGRVYMGQQEGQRQIASAMGQEMLALDKLVTAEESRLRDAQATLDVREATGSQKAASIAEGRSADALLSGMQGVGSMAGQVAAALPDYKKSASIQELGKMEKLGMKQNKLSQADFQKSIASLGTVEGVDFSKVGAMNPMDFKFFMSGVDSNVLQKVGQQLPSSLQSFNPANQALPNTGFDPAQYGYNIPSIGG